MEVLKYLGMKTNSLEGKIEERIKNWSSDDINKQLADDKNNESHEQEEDKAYNCPECPYFSHKEVKHKTYYCSNCDFKCTNKHI